jgi:hypothetical protein
MRAYRFLPFAFQAGLLCPRKKDRAHCAGAKTAGTNTASFVDFAEQRPGYDPGFLEPPQF